MEQILQTTTTRAAAMKQRVVMLAVALAMDIALGMIGIQVLNAQQGPDPRVADLIRAGRVRVGIGLGSAALAIKDSVTGEVRGPALDLARALAERIGIELVPVEYPRPGAVMEGVRTGAWDVTFLAGDPARAAEADWTPPYMQSDLTYLVPAGSSIRTVADADQPGIRIAVPRGDISDLRLSRVLKRAQLVRADTPGAAFDLLRAGRADARAMPRGLALEASSRLPGSRVLEDRFDVLLYAILVPKGYAGRLAYVSEFIEESKASGLVQQTIESAGLRAYQVSPPGNPSAR